MKMIIPKDHFPVYLANIFDRGELFQSRCPGNPILEPTIRIFNLALILCVKRS